ncbi:type I restriction enzyme M protein [Lipingzhangella halophila]|uniref:site-specific DNA-methyltransferase (adenine-specific) n=1 Tax=Lipingzhangella halophila TaxID=1783352 RepID=A0A7W7REY8_9ACTN|nr:class I SAM-dependent DNA methyltransferase [Lipingzhangella halophila]MBB4930669.1 type I restriction enzyme M protein [Lipingzhangella halophila]
MSDTLTQLPTRIWSVADLLRGNFKVSEYGRIVLPFTVLRRLDCVLASTRRDVLAPAEALGDDRNPDQHAELRSASQYLFYNTSAIALADVANAPRNAAHSLLEYVGGFSPNVRKVIEGFQFEHTIWRLNDAEILTKTLDHFLALDLGPALTSREMGHIFEELVRRFDDQASETSGEHTTPHDVGRLAAALLAESDPTRHVPGPVRKVYDPACGTGGMLGEAADHILSETSQARVLRYGQELNPESWAVASSARLMSGDDPDRIKLGNVLVEDRFPDERFDYLLAHPPFGIEWRTSAEAVHTEYEQLGYEGRFGAGLPRINDGSLLFLQHMLAKMKPVDDFGRGGSRVAVLFTASPMRAGSAGSGESEIRRWIVENDLLEGIVALPDQLFHNTGIDTYLWILTNRKRNNRQSRVVLVKAQDHWQKMRRTVGSKRKYLGPDQIANIVRLYGEASSTTAPSSSPRDRVHVVHNQDLLYREITIEHPLRLRFQLTQEGLDQLAGLRRVQQADDPEALLSALDELIGTTWDTKAEAFTALRHAVRAVGQSWPQGTAFEKAVRKAIGVRDDAGEVQRLRAGPEPDPELRDRVVLQLQDDPDEYLRNKILPHTSGAWINNDKERLGCAIPPSQFYLAELDGPFEPLRNFVEQETRRVKLHRPKPDEERPDPPKHLIASYLHSVDSVLDLPDAELDDSEMTPCSGGDLVGRVGNWRLLPPNFGDAVTSQIVLHPVQGHSRVLCEWLNYRNDNAAVPLARDILDTPVPVDLVIDGEVDSLLDDVQENRRALRDAVEGTLPNVFAGTATVSEDIRTATRFIAREARLAEQLIRPLNDPVSRAESSYPFHISALARRYRVSTHPSEQKDGLLKLGEGIARTLGLLALSELITLRGFTNNLRGNFYNGATFATWTRLLDQLLSNVGTPRLPELAELQEQTTRTLLEQIKDFRNRSHHSQGIRRDHELSDEVELLEPLVLSALSSVNWLSDANWLWVERCEYVDESSFRIVGSRLHGSHPSWELLDWSTAHPLRPERVYVHSTRAVKPVDLWPLATVDLCTDCRTRELFLLDRVQGDQVILHSLEEHSLKISYSTTRGTGGKNP